MENQLESLKQSSTIVADSGDFATIATYKPQDATTNPSLILSAAKQEQYASLMDEALYFGKNISLAATHDKLFIIFGREILKIIPGRVSIEVDPRFSFDAKKSQEKAEYLIALFAKEKIDRERILIKLAATWEGIVAAQELEKKSIHCNMTLLFSLPQAVAAAEAKATLISPFVGRILDWYKKKEGKDSFPPHLDPGVMSVSRIFHYYKKFGYKTQIMAASFRSKEEILELSGCDLLTIAPKFLQMLQQSTESAPRKLDGTDSQKLSIEKIHLDKSKFLSLLSQDEMAQEKLMEGIQNFNQDLKLLEELLQKNRERN